MLMILENGGGRGDGKCSDGNGGSSDGGGVEGVCQTRKNDRLGSKNGF